MTIAAAPVLLERDEELRALDAALRGAGEGSGQLVVVEGPAGAGKSWLLRAARVSAAAGGLTVLTARGGELEREFPHAVARQLLERPLVAAAPDERDALLAGPAGVAAGLLGLGGAHAPPQAGDPAFAILNGLYWLVANLAARRPVVLAVDDVHWADAASLRFLVHLAQRLDDVPIALLVGVRTGEPGAAPELLTRLLAEPAARHLAPRPLTVDAARTVLGDVLNTLPDPAFAAACHAATAGNPFLLRQLADAVARDGLAPTAQATERIPALGPRTVARAILLRLGGLGPAAQALAGAAAILGDGADPGLAATVADLSPADATHAADELRRVDLLQPGAATIDFVHPIVRRAVHDELGAAERAAAHARAAAALQRAGAGARAVAPHLLSALPAGDPAVVAQLREAAAQALQEGEPAFAVEALKRALAEPPAPAERAALMAELGAAELRAGDHASAAAHLEHAIGDVAQATERARLRLQLARARSATSGPRSALPILETALRDAGGDRELELRTEVELASLSVLGGDAGSARHAADRLARHADLPGATAAECLVLAALTRRAYLAGRPASEVAGLAKRALAGGHLAGEAGSEAVAYHHAVATLILADDHAAAAAAIAAAFSDARARGSSLGFAFTEVSQAMLSHRTGAVAAAEADARAALDALDDHAAFVALPLASLVHALVERGALEEADAALTAHGAQGELPDELVASRLQLARATLRLAQERTDEALADLDAIADRERRWGVADPEVEWRGCAALVHARRGDDAAARALADEQLEVAGRWAAASIVGQALTVKGLVAQREEAPTLLAEAVRTLDHAPAGLAWARAQTELGAALRRAGRRTDAREPLRLGLDAARKAGATALAERAHAELVAAGARPRRLQFSGAEALTASERRVAEMAAGGRTNRQIAQDLFVSVKTVENHLARAYQKLGVHSRELLAGALVPAEA